MDLNPRCLDKVKILIEKGVDISNLFSIDIGDEVLCERISGKGVKIYPGCRIYGDKTVISRGAQIGAEGPATIDNCQLGADVELKGGYFNKAVFLEKSKMGLGAHVREGSILEEESTCGHCVGLKQTILFPFVTLGSLINFCDCLMAGGTSRRNHSEVGSSYIHFNFTPAGDKATASLIGEVARGVMLRERPIFLGGQGGVVGPARIGYGNVVAAGSVMREDCLDEGMLIFGKSCRNGAVKFASGFCSAPRRILENNILYLANLTALEEWYRSVRVDSFARDEFEQKVYGGALEKLNLAKSERINQLKKAASKIVFNSSSERTFLEQLDMFGESLALQARGMEEDRTFFLEAFSKHIRHGMNYIESIQGLPVDVVEKGSKWLQSIVDKIFRNSAEFFKEDDK
ncbi:MAG: UDP-N-acetylglucosamine pyrophosphorylase [Pseudomonadota bacterium]